MGMIFDCKQIFVSYSRRDIEAVTRIVGELKSHNYELWQDISNIPPSTKWFNVIQESLGESIGAVIFKTRNWEASHPCGSEYGMIEKMHIPFIIISEEEIADENKCKESVAKIAEWIDGIVQDGDNNFRRWLYAGGFRLFKNKKNDYSDFSKGNIIDLVENIKELKECRIDNEAQRLIQDNPEISTHIEKHFRKALNTARRAIAGKIIVPVYIVAAVIMFWTGYTFIRALPLVQEKVNTAINRFVYVSNIKKAMEFDPVMSMQGISSKEMLTEEDDSDMRYKVELMNLALDRKYPVEFFESGSEEARLFDERGEVKESEKYAVEPSDADGRIVIRDKKTGEEKQFVIAAKEEDYAVNSTGTILAVAAENKVYVYDMRRAIEPVELAYNFESVKKVGFLDDSIYAVTDSGNTVIWNNPLLEMTNDNPKGSIGRIYESDQETVTAVYLNGTNVILNNGSSEEVYPLKIDGTIDMQHIAVSVDGSLLAINYKPRGGSSSKTIIFNILDGAVYREIDSGCSLDGIIFSKDGDSIIACDRNEGGIVSINIENGEILKSDSEECTPFEIITYDDGYIVTDTTSGLWVYDNNLNLVSNVTYGAFPYLTKQMDFSKKYGYVFSAYRGGLLQVNAGYNLNDMRQFFLVTPDNLSVISTNCVDVSDDGEFVIYGLPNGQIMAYDADAMEVILFMTKIPEPVMDIRISHNGEKVYALGDSGTLYNIDAEGRLLTSVSDGFDKQWEQLYDDSYLIQKDMYDMGLSYYAPYVKENTNEAQGN